MKRDLDMCVCVCAYYLYLKVYSSRRTKNASLYSQKCMKNERGIELYVHYDIPEGAMIFIKLFHSTAAYHK